MATKFLGKVVAGAALGGVSLLIAPGVAIAAGVPDDAGRLYTKHQWTAAGREVTITEICPEPQQYAWVWSEATGKVALKLAEDDAGGEGYGQPEQPAEPGSATPDGSGVDAPREQDEVDKNNGADSSGWTAPPGAAAEEQPRWVYAATVKLAPDVAPGRYEMRGRCAEGALYVPPKGSISGGDGGATGTDPVLAAGGAGLLGAAVLGGILLVRRRRGDGSPA